VFFLGDRYFGTVTAYVSGAVAAKYKFTSSLAVQLLKSMTPQIQPLLDKAPAPSVAVVNPALPQAPGVVPAIFETRVNQVLKDSSP